MQGLIDSWLLWFQHLQAIIQEVIMQGYTVKTSSHHAVQSKKHSPAERLCREQQAQVLMGLSFLLCAQWMVIIYSCGERSRGALWQQNTRMAWSHGYFLHPKDSQCILVQGTQGPLSCTAPVTSFLSVKLFPYHDSCFTFSFIIYRFLKYWVWSLCSD